MAYREVRLQQTEVYKEVQAYERPERPGNPLPLVEEMHLTGLRNLVPKEHTPVF